jgi:hypothetical protein
VPHSERRRGGGEGAARSVGERAPTGDQDPTSAATCGTQC